MGKIYAFSSTIHCHLEVKLSSFVISNYLSIYSQLKLTTLNISLVALSTVLYTVLRRSDTI